MIYLAHSQSFAYDLLARAVIKVRRHPTDESAKGDLMVLEDQIQQQVGPLLHEQVCASSEYIALLVAHDAADESDAVQLALQRVWFPRT